MSVRPATSLDIPLLAHLSNRGDVPGWTADNLAMHLENGGDIWVAIRDTEIVGYILGRRVLDEAEILNVVVAPAHRRQGYGQALIQAFLAYLRAAGAAEVFLDVRADNVAAQKLYQLAGFERIAVRPGFYRLDAGRPEVSRDAVTMRMANFKT